MSSKKNKNFFCQQLELCQITGFTIDKKSQTLSTKCCDFRPKTTILKKYWKLLKFMVDI